MLRRLSKAYRLFEDLMDLIVLGIFFLFMWAFTRYADAMNGRADEDG